ncbi:MAG: IS30 family transposase [Polaromonas sp.]
MDHRARSQTQCFAARLHPAKAHAKARLRQTDRRNARQISAAQWLRVEAYLRLFLSPEQVAGRLRLEGVFTISHEAIYQYIYRDKRRGGDLIGYMRCQKVRRKRYGSGQERRGVLKGRVCIDKRPPIVDRKSRIGDWEGDTVIGKGHQGALVTLVERKSRYTLSSRVASKHSEGVTQAVIALLRPHQHLCHTVTFDNGKEFAEHAFIAQCLQADVYFAHPYHSWERGLNENTNGLLRQRFPKSTNFLKVSDQDVEEAVYQLNHRPRKCLGFRTPHEAFHAMEMKPLTLALGAFCN